MKYRRPARLSAIAFVLVAAFLTTACPEKRGPGATAPKQVIIAGNIPLTGPIAMFSGQYGKAFAMGLDDATKAVNEPRSAFKEDFQDNAGKTTTAVAVMRQQMLSDPALYISGTSAMSDAVIGEVAKTGTPHFLVSFDAYMTHGRPTVLRVLPNFMAEAPIFDRFIKSRKAKKVFFFTPNLKAYLEQSDKLILPSLAASGVQYQRELFEFDQKEFRTLAEKAAQYQPDAIIISGYAFHVYPIIRALRELGLVQKASVMCTLDFIDLVHGDASRDDLKGIWFTAPECEIPGKVAGYDLWRKAFESRYGKSPSYVDAYGYDTARIVAAAYKKNGNVSVPSLLSVVPFKGIVGEIRLDKERDLSSTLAIGYFNQNAVVEEYQPQ